MKYILNEKGDPVVCNDLDEWVTWFENSLKTSECLEFHRRVAHDQIGDVSISTVFLALDHAFGGGAPILWETMIFGGEHDQYQRRCSGSREQAEKMHADAYKLVTGKDWVRK